MSEVRLGSKVRDPITGVEGIAESRTTYLYGCPRIYIQPPYDKGKEVEGLTVDLPQLEVVEVGCVKGGPPDRFVVELGDVVYDPIAKVTSVVTAQSTYLNGCCRVYLEPLPVWYKRTPESYWVHQQQVVPKGRSLLRENTNPESTRDKGGPSGPCPKY